MQTFLPYTDFLQSSRCLDRQRLGKQRVEVIQILKALTDPTYGWQHHPAVGMWRGAELALGAYGLAVCEEWIARGYEDNCRGQIAQLMLAQPGAARPWWLGDERLHSSHRANLLRKDRVWYSQWNWAEEPDAEYWWPTQHLGGR